MRIFILIVLCIGMMFIAPTIFKNVKLIQDDEYRQMTEATGKAQLRQLEDVNENLRDIKGLLNSIAENTRK
jgi:hypothetical protein